MERPRLIGFTGASSTCTAIYMLRSILDGDEPYTHVGVVCSLETFDGVERCVGWRGAPDSCSIARHLAHARTAGLEYLVIELPGGEQAENLFGCSAFDIVCSLDSGLCVERSGIEITFSRNNTDADVRSDSERSSYGITSFAARTLRWQWRIAFPLPGLFNVANALATIAVCEMLGIEPARIAERFLYVRVPGRMELVLTPDRDVVGIIDSADDEESRQAFFSAVAEEFPGYRIETARGDEPSRKEAIVSAVERAYASGELALVCLLDSGGDPLRARRDADIFNDAVRSNSRYIPL